MGLGSVLKKIGGIGSIVAAPFTGGASLIPLVTTGISALGGALEGRKGARTTTGTPTLSPEYQGLADLLRARTENRLRSSADLSGYTGTGLSNINDVYGGLQQSLTNSLTSRGLATSPIAATAQQNLDVSRGGNIIEFLNNLPLLQRQMELEDLGIAGDVLNFGRGTSTVGPGSVLGGAFNEASEMLAYLAGKGLLGKQAGGGSVVLPGPAGLPMPPKGFPLPLPDLTKWG